MDDATAIDEAANVFTSPRCEVESFRMKDSTGDVGVNTGVAVADVRLERDFSRECRTGGEQLKPAGCRRS